MDSEAALEALYLACRRRDDSDILPPHALRDSVATAQSWTATRCHRLLRPLLSHLAALRKEEARIAAKRADSAGQRASLESERPMDSSRQLSSSEHGAGPKRVRYTYSLKDPRRRRHQQSAEPSQATVHVMSGTARANTSNLAPSTQHRQQLAGRYVSPGEVVVPTPVLCRATKQRRAFSLPSSPLTSHTCTGTVTERGTVLASPSAEAARSRCGIPVYRGYCNGASLHGSSASSENSSAMKDDWARLGSATPGKRFQLYESIFRAFEALLRATSAGSAAVAAKKPRSLLEMCLRKVPQYVVACEEEERQEALQCGATPPTSSQISFEVYNDLESLGHGTDGWQHLRTVVRSHAISLVAAACADGLLHSAFLRILIRLLTILRANAEAESLLVAFVWRNGTYPVPTEGADSVFSRTAGPSEALRIFADYAEGTGRWSCLFQQLDGLLQSGHLPPAWLSTRAFSGIWERIIQTSSSRNISTGEGQASLSFAETATTRLIHCQQDSDSSQDTLPPRLHHSTKSRSSLQHSPSTSSSSYHTLASVLGSLAAVAILQQEAVSGVEDHGAESEAPSLRRLAIMVETCLASDPEAKKRRRVRRSLDNQMSETRKRFLLGLARFLASYGGTENGEDQSGTEAASWCEEISLRSGPEQRRQLYDATITLVASVAQSCGRDAAATADAKPSRIYLSQLCSYVTSRLGSCFSQPNARDDTARRMQADGAFLLASRTNDLRDLAFAESLGVAKSQGRTHRPGVDESPVPSATPPLEAAVSAALVQQHAAPATALFAGYRWEEGISEWVIASPRLEPRAGDADRERRTLVTRSRERSQEQSLSLVSIGYVSVSAATHVGREEIGPVTPHKTPRPDMTTPETDATKHSSAASEESLRRVKRFRPGTQDESWTILSLVSDDADDTDVDQDGFDEISLERKRAPLLRVDGNASGPVGVGLGKRKRKRAVARSSLRADNTSDDELCL